MYIVARGVVVYEFYMEQSSVDFRYIFHLRPNIPLSDVTLISVHATANTIIPAF
jgi:hypothetical protein